MDIVGAIVGGIILVFIGIVIEFIFFEHFKEIWDKYDTETSYRYKSYLLIFSIGCVGTGVFFIILGIILNIFS